VKQTGLIISIDFELDWGYNNKNNPLKEKEILDSLNRIIALFDKYQVKSTWAIVGKLFENKNGIDDSKGQLNWINNTLLNNKLIEIGSHTYSHIFCEEVDIETFNSDVSAMNIISKKNNIKFKSMVFPRNQYNLNNIKILQQNGYTHFRNVLQKWYLKTSKYSDESKIKRFLVRLLELLPLKRDVEIKIIEELISVSDSRFFRIYPPGLLGKLVTPLYIMVLKNEFKKNIRRRGLYHIWFHPHNLIKNPNGFIQLDAFLEYYSKFKNKNQSISSYHLSEIRK